MDINKRDIKLFFQLLVFSIVFFGLLSLYKGRDLSWDLAHYHYLNGYRFLHADTIHIFFPISFIHQFINPLLDEFNYLIINLFQPKITMFISGSIAGLNFICVFYLALFFIAGDKYNAWKLSLAFILAIIGMYAPTVWPGIGLINNDLIVSILVLCFLYFEINVCESKPHKVNLHILAGILLGIAIGLKYTVGMYALASIPTLLFLSMPFREKIKLIVILGCAISIGILISAGFWMVPLWIKYHNPIFPFLNKLFLPHSTLPLPEGHDIRFLPTGWLEYFYYPFYFQFSSDSAEAFYFDCRFPLAFTLFFIVALTKLTKMIQPSFKNSERYLLLFFVFSFYIWIIVFSIARYMATLQIVAPIVIYILLRKLIKHHTYLMIALALSMYSIVFFMIPTNTIRNRIYPASYFNVSLPTLPVNDSAVVMLSYTAPIKDELPKPILYLIPFLPKHWTYVGIPFDHYAYQYEPQIHKQIENELKKQAQHYFFISEPSLIPEMFSVAKRFGFKQLDSCKYIYSDRQFSSNRKTMICEIK